MKPSRIPESEYIAEHKTRHVTLALLKKYHTIADVRRFNEWFDGQTGAVLRDGTLGIYASDYERWIGQGRQTMQRVEDWD